MTTTPTDRNYNQSYHDAARLTSARGSENSTAPNLRLLDTENSLPSDWMVSAQCLAIATAAFLARNPRTAPLIAPELSPSVLWAARFALAADSPSLTCRVF